MSTDVFPKAQSHPQPSGLQRRGNPGDTRRGWRWKLGLLTIGVVAVVAIAATYIRGAMSPRESGPKLTHTIARDDLVVSVTEQGTLESSNNTEIKCKVRGYSTVIWVIEGGTEVKPGDELVRLDTKQIEDAISLQTTNVWTAKATLEESIAAEAKAEIAISAYLEGTYRSQKKALDRQLVIARRNLRTAKKSLEQSEKLFNRGYVTDLEVKGNEFTVERAGKELEVIQTQIKVLETYTKNMQLVTLNGNLKAARSKLKADEAGLAMDEGRRDLAKKELEYCVIKADRSGLVIYPSTAKWKQTPDITEGATVRKDQVLLLMPDLSKMQVRVGIHESIVDRIKPGLAARVTLPDKTLGGKVSSVASVTRPAGWWTGNVVKYDTIIELPSVEGLKPGMSAEVEVIMDRHEDVLTIPVAAVVETEEGEFCWVKTVDGPKRRSLHLGDTNDQFIVVEAGLKEGDEVVLNPLAFIEEAQSEVLKPFDETKQPKPDSDQSGTGPMRPVSLETDHVD